MDTITFKEAQELNDKVFIDVRSPLEFSQDHILGAVNIPVFLDEERAIIGTIYRNEGSAKAVDKGIYFFSKRLSELTASVREYEGRNLIAYCWRGGMRSKAFVSFLRSLNFNILQLDGGYKSFRSYVREALYNFDIKPKFICIHGVTGTGKTEIIQKLAPISIDLEGLASHRSSLFGHVGLNPRDQKMFENMLLEELKRVSNFPFIFVEGESKKIGDINIPEVFFKKMDSGVIITVASDIPIRVKRIVAEYFDSPEKINQIKDVMNSHPLVNKLGERNITRLNALLESGDYENFVEILLEKYYDPLYMHFQKRFKGSINLTSDNIDETVKEISKLSFD